MHLVMTSVSIRLKLDQFNFACVVLSFILMLLCDTIFFLVIHALLIFFPHFFFSFSTKYDQVVSRIVHQCEPMNCCSTSFIFFFLLSKIALQFDNRQLFAGDRSMRSLSQFNIQGTATTITETTLIILRSFIWSIIIFHSIRFGLFCCWCCCCCFFTARIFELLPVFFSLLSVVLCRSYIVFFSHAVRYKSTVIHDRMRKSKRFTRNNGGV